MKGTVQFDLLQAGYESVGNRMVKTLESGEKLYIDFLTEHPELGLVAGDYFQQAPGCAKTPACVQRLGDPRAKRARRRQPHLQTA